MQQWHEIRARNVGGSEVAALFGESPYSSLYQLWHIKAGILPPTDFSGNDRIDAGNWLEGAIISWAKSKYGMAYYQPPKMYAQHPSVTGMGCTPDAFVEGDDKIIAQVKNVDAIQFGKKWKSDGDNIEEVPLHIFLQCQHEMACTGAEENHLIALVGGNRLMRKIILRDNEVIKMIEDKVAFFWKTIELNEPPMPDYKHDGDAIIQIKGKLSIGNHVDLSNDNQLTSAAVAYDQASVTIKEAEALKNEAKAIIMDRCLGYDVVTVGNHEIKIVRTSGTPDKVITEDMVGQVQKGRSASVYPRIKTLTGE